VDAEDILSIELTRKGSLIWNTLKRGVLIIKEEIF